MSKGNQLSDEALSQLEFCSSIVGRYEYDSHSQSVFSQCWDNISSPIEQLLYISICTLHRLYSLPRYDTRAIDGKPYEYGLRIIPQFTIRTYRVDFYVEWCGYGFVVPESKKSVVVECDSQQWHERTEQERRYEKRRDRDLAQLGLHTFRFTGKEIKEDPFKPVAEVLGFVTGRDFSDYQETIDLYRG